MTLIALTPNRRSAQRPGPGLSALFSIPLALLIVFGGIAPLALAAPLHQGNGPSVVPDSDPYGPGDTVKSFLQNSGYQVYAVGFKSGTDKTVAVEMAMASGNFKPRNGRALDNDTIGQLSDGFDVLYAQYIKTNDGNRQLNASSVMLDWSHYKLVFTLQRSVYEEVSYGRADYTDKVWDNFVAYDTQTNQQLGTNGFFAAAASQTNQRLSGQKFMHKNFMNKNFLDN